MSWYSGHCGRTARIGGLRFSCARPRGHTSSAHWDGRHQAYWSATRNPAIVTIWGSAGGEVTALRDELARAEEEYARLPEAARPVHVEPVDVSSAFTPWGAVIKVPGRTT